MRDFVLPGIFAFGQRDLAAAGGECRRHRKNSGNGRNSKNNFRFFHNNLPKRFSYGHRNHTNFFPENQYFGLKWRNIGEQTVYGSV